MVCTSSGPAIGMIADENGAEERLVRSAVRGDVAAFEALYRRHVGRVFALCLRMTADRHAAEDLTQEAFVRAWERLGSFRGDAALSTWLHRLTVNVVLGHLRRRGRRPESPAESAAGSPEVHVPPAPGESAVDLERAIAGLPDRARTVFVLHDVEGYRHEEIASMAGMAVGTSKATLHRARRMLRKALS